MKLETDTSTVWPLSGLGACLMPAERYCGDQGPDQAPGTQKSALFPCVSVVKHALPSSRETACLSPVPQHATSQVGAAALTGVQSGWMPSWPGPATGE